MPSDGARTRVTVAQLAPHLVCTLCGGYYVDATTIAECLHTFCRSCILRHLRTTRCCPAATCDVLIHRTKGATSLRPDTTLQSIVYKTVPGLYRDEMRRRRQFYLDKLDADTDLPLASKGAWEEGAVRFYSHDDSIGVRIQYAPQSPEDIVPVRFLRCPASLPLNVLRKFLYQKYRFSERLQIELIHGRKVLPLDVTLLDVAYIVNWTGEAPMKLAFRLKITELAPKRAASDLESAADPSAKIRRLDPCRTSATAPSSEDTVPKATAGHTTRSRSHPSPIVANDRSRGISSSRSRASNPKAGAKQRASSIACSIVQSKRSDRPDVSVAVSSMGTSRGSAGVAPGKRPGSKPIDSASLPSKMRKLSVNQTTTNKPKSQTHGPIEADAPKTLVPVHTLNAEPKVATVVLAQKPDGASKTTTVPPTVHVDVKQKARSIGSSSEQNGDKKPKTPSTVPHMKPADDEAKTAVVARNREPFKGQSCIPATAIPNMKLPVQRESKSAPRDGILVDQTCRKENTLQPKTQTEKQQEHNLLREKVGQKEQGTMRGQVETKKHCQGKLDGKDGALEEARESGPPCGVTESPSRSVNADASTKLKLPVTKVDCSVQTFPIYMIRAKQDPGKLSKTVTHGTNTLLSSSYRGQGPQASQSSNTTALNTCNPAGSRPKTNGGKPYKAITSQAKSVTSLYRPPPATTSLSSISSGSKDPETIFLISGAKKPQCSNKIMSIVESLTQRSLTSLAQRGADGKPKEHKGNGGATPSPRTTPPPTSKPPSSSASSGGSFVAPAPVSAQASGAAAGRSVSSPLHIETATLGLRYSSAVPPLAGLARPAPASAPAAARPVFPVLPLPQRPKSQGVRSIPNPSLVRQRSAEERARDSSKSSPTAGATAPAMSPPCIRDIHSLTRQLQEAGTSVTVTDKT
ncbi:polycomb group protein Psc-like isoform X2 [Pollicipes pollicipes]|nr:polycomb group protein Psc-like isoform X2 [Pollicipes pollicipes]